MKKYCLFLLLSFIALQCSDTSENNRLDSGRFTNIEAKLDQIAMSIGAKITAYPGGANINGVPVPVNKIELRNVTWKDGIIAKTIIISPNSEGGDINRPTWDFFNMAWLDDTLSAARGKAYHFCKQTW